MKQIRIIVSGGGTGGHIYPAVAVVEALERRLGREQVSVLFVGAEGKMEMTKVPSLGYRIEGLPIVGLQRRLTLRNLQVPGKILRSLNRSRRILKEFRPDVVAGFGGYASLPLLWQAQRMHLPTVVWEGNSFAGMANRLLSRRICAACVSYEGMERFFPADRIVKTGNPVRGVFGRLPRKSPEALSYFGFDGSRPVLLVTGGSLGARVVNRSVQQGLSRLISRGEIDLIWQTGSYYYEEMRAFLSRLGDAPNVWCAPFIERMDYAYSAADLAVSRAGASAVTELSLSGVPALFIPSSNVTDDHQTKNASALVSGGAAVMLSDAEAEMKMLPVAESLLFDGERLERMSRQIRLFSQPDAADRMAGILLRAAERKEQ